MTVDEAIEELQRIKQLHGGDTQLTAWRDGRLCHATLSTIERTNVLKKTRQSLAVVETGKELKP